ncbi:MAG: ankyrin repeat domain-containing protein [Planctomycetaceae bacterium]|nr:ankyrin repeat domain-containing protein [Planctomycetaceae bacterium]
MHIHSFASQGDCDGVRGELAKGVSVDTRDELNFTPLAYAAGSPDANEEMIRLLIDAGADVNAIVDHSRKCPLGLAVCSGALEKAQVLSDSSADINFVSPQGYTVLIDVVHSLHDDETLVQIVEYLVSNGAEIDCESDYGESPLSVTSHLGRFDAVTYLLDAGADPTPLQWTKLMKAVASETCGEVQRQLDLGGRLDDRDRWDRTPWLLASIVGDVEKAKVIHSAGPNPDDRGRGGDTALMYCAARGHADMLNWLIQIGVAIEAVDEASNTALMLAAQMGHAECVSLLLQSGADPSRMNEYDDNAISMASNELVMRLLCDAGEDMADISTEMKRTHLGLDGGDALRVNTSVYESGCRPRVGRANPEVMEIPLWKEMVRTGISAHQAKAQFRDEDNMTETTWCFDRFGMSFTELPDDRFVQIGGEHEDYYDPDFCIYKDVVVHERSGAFQIMG